MFIFLVILTLLYSTLALPTFNDFGNRATIYSLTPEASQVHAFARHERSISTLVLALHDPAHPGNLTALPLAHASASSNYASLYVHKNRLWVYRNESAIWLVNFVNVTNAPGFPLQLVAGTEQFGVTQGTWTWWGTMLYYDHGTEWQMFFMCQMPHGKTGIFLYIMPPAPTHCNSLTFHSSQRRS